ncbi:MAG: hypothetical protein KAU07_00710 [Candidatus Andersenbacteria bacterium]|nr:hypothetical protein [Candidatus Andersenbacteria bacterium]
MTGRKRKILVLLTVFVIAIIVFIPVSDTKASAVSYILPGGIGFGIDAAINFVSLLKSEGIGSAVLNNPIFIPIYFIIYTVVGLFLWLMSLFTVLAAWLVDIFINPDLYTVVFGSTALVTGWEVVRDAVNTFFVLILLVIAFGTILRSKTINAKNILPKFIIAIFLINFSAIIAKLVIDIGQVFMFEIRTWMGSFSGNDGLGGGAGTLTSIVSHYHDIYLNWGIFPASKEYTFRTVIGIIFATGHTALLALVYVMLAVFLLIRIVALAILIVLSPLAFFGIILPGMNKYTSEWWSSIIKYSFFGPIFLFFVYLSTQMANTLTNDPVLNFSTTVPATSGPMDLGILSYTIAYLVPHSIAIAMLAAAPIVANRLSMYGANKIVGGRLGLGNVGMGLWGAGKKSWGYGKKAGGVATARSKKVASTVDKVRKGKQTILSKIPGIGKGLALGDKAQEQKGKQEKVDNRVAKYGGDLEAIDVKLAMEGDDIDKAIGLKAAAVQKILGDRDSRGNLKYKEQFMIAREHLSDKDIGEISDRNLEMATMTKEAQQRITGKDLNSFSGEAQQRINDKGGTKEAYEEEIMREKVAEQEKEGNVHKFQGLEGEMASRAWTEGQTKDGLKVNIKRLTPEEQSALAKGIGRNIERTGDAKMMKTKLKIDGKLEETINMGITGGFVENKDSVTKLAKGLSPSDLAKIKGDDLSRLSEVVSHNQIKNLLKAGEDDMIEEIDDLLSNKIVGGTGTNHYGLSDPEIGAKRTDINTQLTS